MGSNLRPTTVSLIQMVSHSESAMLGLSGDESDMSITDRDSCATRPYPWPSGTNERLTIQTMPRSYCKVISQSSLLFIHTQLLLLCQCAGNIPLYLYLVPVYLLNLIPLLLIYLGSEAGHCGHAIRHTTTSSAPVLETLGFQTPRPGRQSLILLCRPFPSIYLARARCVSPRGIDTVSR